VEHGTRNSLNFERIVDLVEVCLKKINYDDVLVHVNMLEILQHLCFKDYGVAFLESNGMLKKYATELKNVNILLLPSLIKFFGNIAVLHPEKIFSSTEQDQFNFLIDLLFDVILQENIYLLYEALNILGNIAKLDKGKIAIDNYCGEKFCQVLKCIFIRMPNYTSEIKIRAINCLKNIFHIDNNANNQVNVICQKWFDFTFESSLSKVLCWCQSPFTDLALCAFKLLKSLCDHKFIPEIIASTGGLIEFLLDRKNNFAENYDVKHVKYDIMKKLMESTSFDASTLSEINKYVQDGVFFIEQSCEIAHE
jgi:Proteasome non-ATPase 26S subunit